MGLSFCRFSRLDVDHDASEVGEFFSKSAFNLGGDIVGLGDVGRSVDGAMKEDHHLPILVTNFQVVSREGERRFGS